jgi:PAS domain S-box-containing protein
MATTAADAGSKRRLRDAARFRLRFALYVAAFLLPLGAATFAFARYAADGVRERADTRLNTGLRTAVSQYATELETADRRAAELASSERVRRALAERDRPELRRIARAYPGLDLAFYAGAELLAGRVAPLSAQRSVTVRAGTSQLGRVVTSVPLDDALLERIERAVRMPAGDALVLGQGIRVLASSSGAARTIEPPGARAEDVRLGGDEYRGVSVTLADGPEEVWLAHLTPRDEIAQSSGSVQRRVLLAGSVTIAFVGLLGYGLAPAIARSRVSQNQRAQAARVLAQVGDGVFLVDGDGTVQFWNPAAEAITGLPASAVLGHRIDEAVPGWSAVAERIPVARNGFSGRRPAEVVPLELSGRDLWLSIAGVESTEGSVYTFRDLTDEHRLEKAKADFVSTVSHELRTPLASIHGAALTLRRRREGLDGPMGEQLLDVIAEQSDRLSHLVGQILLAGRLDSDRLEVARETFDPESVARAVVETTRIGLPERLSLELQVPDTLPPVMGDPDQARQVLGNLIENAIKYTPWKGRIDVELAPTEDGVRFSVSDEGLGIPPAETERIFEKFYRLDPEMSRGIGGSGLGLYICRELVRRMDGKIWVESELGAGSTFSFELPFAGRDRQP